MKKRLLSLVCAAFLLLPLLTAAPVHGADSTSFDPTKVEVKAQGSGGVPVGMILAWPVGQNPEDMDNWLECNGQSISQSVYPELFALLGGNVPDLRGLFLRGHGGNSAALGSLQQGTLPDHKHVVGQTVGYMGYVGSGWGAFVPIESYDRGFGLSGPAILESAGENRPVNTSVRYLIRARP